jgi:hypothetical protein
VIAILKSLPVSFKVYMTLLNAYAQFLLFVGADWAALDAVCLIEAEEHYAACCVVPEFDYAEADDPRDGK